MSSSLMVDDTSVSTGSRAARVVPDRRGHSVTGATQCLIDTWNDNPRPYVWTKTADQILSSIGNYCTRMNDSGH